MSKFQDDLENPMAAIPSPWNLSNQGPARQPTPSSSVSPRDRDTDISLQHTSLSHCFMSALRNPTNPHHKNTSNTPPTSKRTTSFQSLNHLTNFSLPPRIQHPTHNAVPRRSRKYVASAPIWNKEKFVNAQYRFVMKPTGDYTVHFADPDIFFQWGDILQVLIPPSHIEASITSTGARTPEALADSSPSTEPINTNCPICLSSPPIAPRVTKCGHIFCFPCILRYLSLGTNPKWNRCPICFDSVNEKHLKCVAWQQDSLESGVHQDAAKGATLTMRLVERPQITTLALPRSSSWPSDLIPPHQAPFHFLPDVSRFAKFMLATPSYIIANLTQELDQIEHERQVLESDERFRDELGLHFVATAETKVKRQIEKATNLETPLLRAAIEKAERSVRDVERLESTKKQKSIQPRSEDKAKHTEADEVPEALLSQRPLGLASSSSPADDTNLTTIASRPQKSRRNVNPPPHSTSTYYFYQAANGAPVFLHPLDIRILHSHFKSYTDFPDTITFSTTSQSFTSSTINNDLRKRCKYLAHLPEAADVVFVEAGWELEGIVGAEDLKPFEAALKTRVGKRRDKDRRDERAKTRAEERERESIMRSARIPSTPFNYDTSTQHDFGPASLPDYDLSAVHGAYSPLNHPSALPEDNPAPNTSAPAPSSTPRPGAWGTRSFATAISTAAPAAPSMPPARRTRRPLDSDEAQWEHDIDAAWQELEGSMLAGAGGGRRKKAGKKLVLLTGGRRG